MGSGVKVRVRVGVRVRVRARVREAEAHELLVDGLVHRARRVGGVIVAVGVISVGSLPACAESAVATAGQHHVSCGYPFDELVGIIIL